MAFKREYLTTVGIDREPVISLQHSYKPLIIQNIVRATLLPRQSHQLFNSDANLWSDSICSLIWSWGFNTVRSATGTTPIVPLQIHLET